LCGGRIKENKSLVRTEGGHRRYDVSELLGTKNDSSLTVGYARCSYDQKEDWKRQVLV